MQSLTKKQKLILDFINSYINENGISPTNDEIRKKFKLKAISTVHEHVNALREKGYISKSDNLSRSISIKKKIKKTIKIPIVGKLIAYKTTNNKMNSSLYFALRVKGDHMSEEGIFDGDIVIIKNM